MMQDKLNKSAKEIVDFIADKKNVAIFHDNDPDGICSGVLLSKFVKLKGKEVKLKLHFTDKCKPFSDIFNDKLIKNEIDLLIFTDFSISGYGYFDLHSEFVKSHPNIKIIVLDHHASLADYGVAENVLYLNSGDFQKNPHPEQYCCSKFVYDLIFEVEPDFIKPFDWISAIGIIGDHNHISYGKFICDVIIEENKNIDLKNSAVVKLLNKRTVMKEVEKHRELKHIFIPEEEDDYLATPFGVVSNLIFYGVAKDNVHTEKLFDGLDSSKDVFEFKEKLKEFESIQKEIDDYLETFEYFMKSPEYKSGKSANKNESDLKVYEIEIQSNNRISSIVANKISGKDKDAIFFVYHLQDNGIYHVSVRLQTGLVNLGKIMEESCKNILNSKGGGHRAAAGAIIPKNLFAEFRAAFYDEIDNVKLVD